MASRTVFDIEAAKGPVADARRNSVSQFSSWSVGGQDANSVLNDHSSAGMAKCANGPSTSSA